MKSSQVGRLGAVTVLGIAAAEVIIMISPFAGFFYARLRFEPLLGFLSENRLTAWLDGFFLNHAVVTASPVLEWHRKAGLLLLGGGLLGFFVSAAQVYGKKILKRGVAGGLLYRFVRHPQYVCLAIAGYGLLVMWPRFLLLGIWVTMLFLYAGLARFEERRMEERFGEEYRTFAGSRGAFLPGSPVRRLFEATFGTLRPRVLGWGLAYVVSLALAFSTALALRAYTRASAAIVFRPEDNTVIVSAWPQPDEWITKVYDAALAGAELRQRLQAARAEAPVVATILPPRYGMRGMYYKEGGDRSAAESSASHSGGRAPSGGSRSLCGVDPDSTDELVELVFSRAAKPYKRNLDLGEALDPGVRLTPLLIVTIDPRQGEVLGVRVPLPQNAWGPNVVMPVL